MVSHEAVLAVLEELAPRVCADPGDEARFEARFSEHCRRIGVCVDPTERNLYRAASDGADFVIIHHPWRQEAGEVVKAKGINLYRLHSSWDLAPDGNLATLARTIGLHSLVFTGGALTGTYGHTLRDLLDRCLRLSGQTVLAYCGDLPRRAETVGIIPGSGFLPVYLRRWETLAQAGCDTLISAEISHSAARFAQARGLNLVDLGHSGLAKPGMAHLASLLKSRLAGHGCEAEFYDDTYVVNYFASWTLPGQGENHQTPETSGGIVLPFPR